MQNNCTQNNSELFYWKCVIICSSLMLLYHCDVYVMFVHISTHMWSTLPYFDILNMRTNSLDIMQCMFVQIIEHSIEAHSISPLN